MSDHYILTYHYYGSVGGHRQVASVYDLPYGVEQSRDVGGQQQDAEHHEVHGAFVWRFLRHISETITVNVQRCIAGIC